MLGGFSFITAVVKFFAGVVEYFQRQQLLDAGKAEANAKTAELVIDNVKKAKDVKENIVTDSDFSKRVRIKYTREDD